MKKACKDKTTIPDKSPKTSMAILLPVLTVSRIAIKYDKKSARNNFTSCTVQYVDQIKEDFAC